MVATLATIHLGSEKAPSARSKKPADVLSENEPNKQADNREVRPSEAQLVKELRERGLDTPVMVSGTITDRSGRTLTGQTPEAFYNSVRHGVAAAFEGGIAPWCETSDGEQEHGGDLPHHPGEGAAPPESPFRDRPARSVGLLSVGLNCALGPDLMRAHLEELSQVAECFTTCHPNAGLPNAMGGYDETPEDMAAAIRDFAEAGFGNILGGCCGTTPEHNRAMAEAVKDLPRD